MNLALHKKWSYSKCHAMVGTLIQCRLFHREKLFDDVFGLIKCYLIKYRQQSSKVYIVCVCVRECVHAYF